jgi:CO dehydrogenase maturation factor
MPIEPSTIAITGKGGVGKTSFTVLLLKALLAHTHKKVLVIDADPAANLADVLGIPLRTTVGQIIDKTKREVEKKTDFYDGGALLEFRLWEDALLEDHRFHFIAMGHTCGRGCYCMIHDLLSYILANIQSYYDIILLDMDAGLEHISRNTKRELSLTFLVTDPSQMGFNTVRRIIELAQELHNLMGKFLLVGNMFSTDKDQEKVRRLAEVLEIPLFGVIPCDENITRMNLYGIPLMDIPLQSSAYQAVDCALISLIKEMQLL